MFVFSICWGYFFLTELFLSNQMSEFWNSFTHTAVFVLFQYVVKEGKIEPLVIRRLNTYIIPEKCPWPTVINNNLGLRSRNLKFSFGGIYRACKKTSFGSRR